MLCYGLIFWLLLPPYNEQHSDIVRKGYVDISNVFSCVGLKDYCKTK